MSWGTKAGKFKREKFLKLIFHGFQRYLLLKKPYGKDRVEEIIEESTSIP